MNEREIKPTVIKKKTKLYLLNLETCNSSTLWTFSVVQLVLIPSWRLTRLAKRKFFSRRNSLIVPKRITYPALPQYNEFFSRLRNCNRLDKAYSDYQSFVNSGCSSEEPLKKFRVSSILPTGQKNYAYLQQVWQNHDLQSFKHFPRWYNNKDVVPTFQEMKKVIEFYHSKRIDMLKLGCTSPNIANICLHSSTNVKFYPFSEGDKYLLEKIREDMVGGPSIVFTR